MEGYTQIYVLFAASAVFFIMIFALICYYRNQSGKYRTLLADRADYCDDVLEDQEHLLAYSTWKTEQADMDFESPEELLRNSKNREIRKKLFEEVMVFFNIETAPGGGLPRKRRRDKTGPEGFPHTRDLIPLKQGHHRTRRRLDSVQLNPSDVSFKEDEGFRRKRTSDGKASGRELMQLLPSKGKDGKRTAKQGIKAAGKKTETPKKNQEPKGKPSKLKSIGPELDQKAQVKGQSKTSDVGSHASSTGVGSRPSSMPCSARASKMSAKHPDDTQLQSSQAEGTVASTTKASSPSVLEELKHNATKKLHTVTGSVVGPTTSATSASSDEDGQPKGTPPK